MDKDKDKDKDKDGDRDREMVQPGNENGPRVHKTLGLDPRRA